MEMKLEEKKEQQKGNCTAICLTGKDAGVLYGYILDVYEEYMENYHDEESEGELYGGTPRQLTKHITNLERFSEVVFGKSIKPLRLKYVER